MIALSDGTTPSSDELAIFGPSWEKLNQFDQLILATVSQSGADFGQLIQKLKDSPKHETQWHAGLPSTPGILDVLTSSNYAGSLPTVGVK